MRSNRAGVKIKIPTARNFCPLFGSSMHRQIGRALGRNYGTLPNPLAGVIDVIVRSYRLEVGYDRRQGPPRFRTIKGRPKDLPATLRHAERAADRRLDLSVLVTPGREQGPCST